jgi:hypothetical protein
VLCVRPVCADQAAKCASQDEDEEEDDKIRGVIVSLNIILSWCDLHT